MARVRGKGRKSAWRCRGKASGYCLSKPIVDNATLRIAIIRNSKRCFAVSVATALTIATSVAIPRSLPATHRTRRQSQPHTLGNAFLAHIFNGAIFRLVRTAVPQPQPGTRFMPPRHHPRSRRLSPAHRAKWTYWVELFAAKRLRLASSAAQQTAVIELNDKAVNIGDQMFIYGSGDYEMASGLVCFVGKNWTFTGHGHKR